MRPAWGHSREVQPRGRISSCLEPWQRDSGFMVSPEIVSRPLPHLRPTPMTPCGGSQWLSSTEPFPSAPDQKRPDIYEALWLFKSNGGRLQPATLCFFCCLPLIAKPRLSCTPCPMHQLPSQVNSLLASVGLLLGRPQQPHPVLAFLLMSRGLVRSSSLINTGQPTSWPLLLERAVGPV